MLAHASKHVCGLHIQLFNHFFVILQFTRGIFGVMLWNKKFLTTDHHLWTDLIYIICGLSATSRSADVNANEMHAGVVVNCTLQLRNATYISVGHKIEACRAH